MNINNRLISIKSQERPVVRLSVFAGDDSGAVTIDWVGLTAGILLAGMVAIFAIYGNGVTVLTANVNTNMSNLTTYLNPGTVVQQNP